jgi:fucose 4-O-acetylase-like acetyltransferase
MTSLRSVCLDVAGYGILLVVFGHNWIVLHDKGELYIIIYSFHIPLFFFLSGIFFNPNQSLLLLIKQKTRTLLKPYFITLFLVGIVYLLFSRENVFSYFGGVLYGNASTIIWDPLWFLTHLWALFIFAWILLRVTKIDTRNIILKILLLLVLLAIGVTIKRWFWYTPVRFFDKPVFIDEKRLLYLGLPFSLDIIFLTSFYFLLGFFLREKLDRFKFHLPGFIVASALFILAHIFFDYVTDINLRRYDHVIFSTLEALCGIYLIFSLACLLEKANGLSQVLFYIGRGSLFILIFHAFVQDMALQALNIAGNIVGLFNKPFNAVLAFAAGIAIPLILREILKRIRVSGKN